MQALRSRSHRRRSFALLLTAAATASTFACDEGPTEVERKLTTMVMVPASATLEVGESVTLVLQGRDQEGEPISTGGVQWTSDNPVVAGIGSSTSGQARVDAAGPGSTTIRASAAGGVNATASVTVTPGPVDEVTVTPAGATVASGESRTFSATARDAGGHEVETSFTWSAAEGSIADVVDHGDGTATATGRASGSTEIRATAEGRTGTATLTVGAGAPASVVVTPESIALASGEDRQLGATVRDAEGNQVGGADVQWSTSDGNVASVTDHGDGTATVTGGAAGSAIVTASVGALEGTAEVVVAAGSVTNIAISGANSIASGTTTVLTATATDAQGNEVAGAVVRWTSSDTEKARLQAAAAGPGGPAAVEVVGRSVQVLGHKEGVAQVTATSGAASAQINVFVQPGSPAMVTIEPQSLSLRVSESATVRATVQDAAGNTVPDPSVQWSSDNQNTASVVVSDTDETVATVIGEAVGNGAIRATAGAAEGEANVTVSEAPVPMAWARVDADGGLNTSTNLAEDEVHTQKMSTGVVEVTFAEVARWGEHFFVHVSPVDPSPHDEPQAHCFITGQTILLSKDLRVTVRCEKARPAPQQEYASPFRIVVIGDNVLAGSRAPEQRAAFSYNPSHTETQPTAPPADRSWTSDPDASIVMTYDHDAGTVNHTHGAGLRLPFAYHVTQFGGSLNDACEANNWNGNSVLVRCKHPDPNIGPHLVIPHAVLGFEKGRTGAPWGYALVAGSGAEFGSWTAASDGVVSTSRSAEGKYRIEFGFQQSNVDPAILVTPFQNDEWRQCAHRVVEPAPLKVDVVCWNKDGQWADTPFSVAYLK